MSSINNTVETVNAAANAIVSAESRVQPTSVQKRRWGSCWSLYWCFGSYKQNKKINHALLVPVDQSTPPGPSSASLTSQNTNIIFPFIAPPSSPASFLQSDPPSASYSPVGLLSFKSLSQNPPSIFTIGPYTYDTQLVSPPVFSTNTTEPSTASFTPPTESVQITTCSSPEVPFAQLLTSSLARARRHSSGSNHKFIGYEYFSTRKPGSRFGSESGTPNGVSGSATPYGYGLGSRVGSGSLTPNGLGSRLGSGTLTPNLMENQISEVASLANSANNSPKGETLIDHRVSFELTHLDIANNLESSFRNSSLVTTDKTSSEKPESLCESCLNNKNKNKNSSEILETQLGEEGAEKEKQCFCKRQFSSRDFNFDNTNGGVELGSRNNWTFFPMLQPSVQPVKPS